MKRQDLLMASWLFCNLAGKPLKESRATTSIHWTNTYWAPTMSQTSEWAFETHTRLSRLISGIVKEHCLSSYLVPGTYMENLIDPHNHLRPMSLALVLHIRIWGSLRKAQKLGQGPTAMRGSTNHHYDDALLGLLVISHHLILPQCLI